MKDGIIIEMLGGKLIDSFLYITRVPICTSLLVHFNQSNRLTYDFLQDLLNKYIISVVLITRIYF